MAPIMILLAFIFLCQHIMQTILLEMKIASLVNRELFIFTWCIYLDMANQDMYIIAFNEM